MLDLLAIIDRKQEVPIFVFPKDTLVETLSLHV